MDDQTVANDGLPSAVELHAAPPAGERAHGADSLDGSAQDNGSQQHDGWQMALRYPSRLLLVGLALGLAFDLLFNGNLLGISVPVLAILVLVGLALAFRWERARANPVNLWLVLALLFFSVMCSVRASGFLTFLNISACLVLLALIAIYLSQGAVTSIHLPALLLAPLKAPIVALERAGRVTAHTFRHDLAAVGTPARQHAAPILRGLLLAAPVLIVFATLLASADLIFADWIARILSVDLIEMLGRWAGHTLMTLAAGSVLTGGLAYAIRKRAPDWVDQISSDRVPKFPGITEPAIVINGVNLLFALFVIIQLPYLFGGHINIVPGGYTYAEYARRGFGELVVVAVLVLGLILILDTLTLPANARQRLVFSLSSSMLVGLTCVILASAFKRLLMYEMAYGYTQLRVYPHVFMVWLGILLAWFAVTLWHLPGRFAVGLLVVALGFVATLDVLNPDALVVRQNTRRFVSQPAEVGEEDSALGQMDTQYFSRLSADAVPALITAAEQVSGPTRARIETELRRRANEMSQDTDWQKWPAFHLSRARAYRILMERY